MPLWVSSCHEMNLHFKICNFYTVEYYYTAHVTECCAIPLIVRITGKKTLSTHTHTYDDSRQREDKKWIYEIEYAQNSKYLISLCVFYYLSNVHKRCIDFVLMDTSKQNWKKKSIQNPQRNLKKTEPTTSLSMLMRKICAHDQDKFALNWQMNWTRRMNKNLENRWEWNPFPVFSVYYCL